MFLFFICLQLVQTANATVFTSSTFSLTKPRASRWRSCYTAPATNDPRPHLRGGFSCLYRLQIKNKNKNFPRQMKTLWKGFFESPTHVLLPVGLSLSERCYNWSQKILQIKGTARLLLGGLLYSPCYKQSQAPLKSGLPYLCKLLDFQNLIKAWSTCCVVVGSGQFFLWVNFLEASFLHTSQTKKVTTAGMWCNNQVGPCLCGNQLIKEL